MNCISVEVTLAYTWIKLTISPVLSGFQLPNSTQVLLQPSSTCLWLKPHPPINELAIVMTLSRQPLSTDWDKCFPAGNGHRAVQEDCFLNLYMHRRIAVAHSEPTKAFSKRSPETTMLSAPFGCTHPPPPILPLWRSLQEVTSQDESFMPDISGYIWERVNGWKNEY